MSYSKETRHKIYKQLLKRVCKDPRVDCGMCKYLCDITGSSDMWWAIGGIYAFPELNKHKPQTLYIGGPYDRADYYAPCTYTGWERRIKWIEKAIKDTL